MNEIINYLVVFLAGIALGLVFFAGLWWTVQKLISSKHPVLLFFTSLILRSSITLIGFYYIGHHSWGKLVICLIGFIVARFIIIKQMEPVHAS